MNDIILFLKVSILSEFLIFQSNLFHSIIVEGKIMAGILLDCLVLYDMYGNN